jgi:hypothetical protein
LIVDGDATFNNPVTFTDTVTFTQTLAIQNLIVDGYLALDGLGGTATGTQVSFSGFGSDCTTLNALAHDSFTMLRLNTGGCTYRFAFAYCLNNGGGDWSWKILGGPNGNPTNP